MALFVQHGALSDSVSLPAVSLVSRRQSGLQQMTESCKVREKNWREGKRPGFSTARSVLLCVISFIVAALQHTERMLTEVSSESTCRALPDLKITEEKSSFSRSQISWMQTCKPCVTFFSPDNERWLFCANNSFLKTGLISFKKEKTDHITS